MIDKTLNIFFTILAFVLFSFNGFSQKIHFTAEEKQWIKDHPTVQFGYEPRWEPYEIYTENGEYSGIVGD